MRKQRQTIRRAAKSTRSPLRRRRFALPELLEARTLLSAYSVTSNADDGSPGTLRDAITQVNNGLYDAISFSGGMSIAPSSALPAINQPVTISGPVDGAGHPLVELNGSNAGLANGLLLNASGITVSGLAINRFTGDGIRVLSSGDTIQGNFLGTDPSGAIAEGNAVGLAILGNANLVLHNLMSGNASDGVDLTGDSNTLKGNYIGTDSSGTSFLGNQNAGLNVDSASNTLIGGTTAADRNVISGNQLDGVVFTDDTLPGNVLEGDYIGVDALGQNALGNRGMGVNLGTINGLTVSNLSVLNNVISANASDGIYLNNSSNNVIAGNFIGVDANGDAQFDAFGNALHANLGDGITLGRGSSGNLFGGTTASAGNVISGNNGNGVSVSTGSVPAANVFENNLVGVDVAGVADGNGSDGFYVVSGAVQIGAANAGNVISENFGYGVVLGAGGATLQGNFIGTDRTATLHWGNSQDGVYVISSNNLIGGEAAGAGNVLAFNGTGSIGAGVDVYTGTGNSILGNSIFANATLGISLGNDASVDNLGKVTPTPVHNDALGHVGPNNYQNYPVITSAVDAGSSVTAAFTFDAPYAAQGATFAIEFFTNALPDASGFGQGQTFVGSAAVTVDAAGHASGSFTFSSASSSPLVLSATATDTAAGDTSEFSPDVNVQAATQQASTTMLTSSANPDDFGQAVSFTATVTGSGGTPTGNVNFYDGSTLLGTVALPVGSNTATLANLQLPVGVHNILATYAGDAAYSSSSAALNETINRAATSAMLAASATSITLGQSITFTATVTPAPGQYPTGIAPTGTVMFMDGNAVIGTVPLGSNGLAIFSTSSLGLGSHAITAVYNSDANFAAGQSNEIDPVVKAAVGSISGHAYFDVTGDGLSADDKGLSGITVKLYADSDGNGVLDSGDALIASQASDNGGAYSFTGVAAGTYFVQEVTPSGYVRTAPATTTYYTNVMNGNSFTTDDFDNYQTCACKNSVSNVHFVINGKTVVTDLRGHTHQGDTVQVIFTVASGHTDLLSLVSYTAPGSSFNASTAGQQQIFQDSTGTFGPGSHSLTVVIPRCYYQIDFVCGYAIDHFGPDGSNIFYSAEGRLISADNGGTTPPPATH